MVPVSLPQSISNVPYHSQIQEITSHTWQQQGCGITSLAMIIDFYKPNVISVNNLLKQGIASGAFINNVGWSYNGLIQLSKKYGLDGKTYDFAALTADKAYGELKNKLKDGPVIVSVHYKFDRNNPMAHMVVIDGVDHDTVYYNDPSGKVGMGQISSTKFLSSWKKRFIVIRPVKDTAVAMARVAP